MEKQLINYFVLFSISSFILFVCPLFIFPSISFSSISFSTAATSILTCPLIGHLTMLGLIAIPLFPLSRAIIVPLFVPLFLFLFLGEVDPGQVDPSGHPIMRPFVFWPFQAARAPSPPYFLIFLDFLIFLLTVIIYNIY